MTSCLLRGERFLIVTTNYDTWVFKSFEFNRKVTSYVDKPLQSFFSFESLSKHNFYFLLFNISAVNLPNFRILVLFSIFNLWFLGLQSLNFPCFPRMFPLIVTRYKKYLIVKFHLKAPQTTFLQNISFNFLQLFSFFLFFYTIKIWFQ